jgi:hypothetical protein
MVTWRSVAISWTTPATMNSSAPMAKAPITIAHTARGMLGRGFFVVVAPRGAEPAGWSWAAGVCAWTCSWAGERSATSCELMTTLLLQIPRGGTGERPGPRLHSAALASAGA